MFYCHKYKAKEFFRNNSCDVRRLSNVNESFERAVAYVQMNPVAANICLDATQYEWGTGSSFFNHQAHVGVPLQEFSFRQQIILMHSKVRLPQGYRLHNGHILPTSFVKRELVESIFKTPRRMHFFLVNSSKAKSRIENREAHIPSFKDQSLYLFLTDLCRSLFNQDKIDMLQREQQAEVIRQIRYRFSADVAQISRITGIPYEDVCRSIDVY